MHRRLLPAGRRHARGAVAAPAAGPAAGRGRAGAGPGPGAAVAAVDAAEFVRRGALPAAEVFEAGQLHDAAHKGRRPRILRRGVRRAGGRRHGRPAQEHVHLRAHVARKVAGRLHGDRHARDALHGHHRLRRVRESCHGGGAGVLADGVRDADLPAGPAGPRGDRPAAQLRPAGLGGLLPLRLPDAVRPPGQSEDHPQRRRDLPARVRRQPGGEQRPVHVRPVRRPARERRAGERPAPSRWR